jgi:hypothetical protein
MLSEGAMQEFKTLWLEEFGEEISNERAMEIAPKLLDLFNHIYRPVKKKWLEDISNENNNENETWKNLKNN